MKHCAKTVYFVTKRICERAFACEHVCLDVFYVRTYACSIVVSDVLRFSRVACSPSSSSLSIFQYMRVCVCVCSIGYTYDLSARKCYVLEARAIRGPDFDVYVFNRGASILGNASSAARFEKKKLTSPFLHGETLNQGEMPDLRCSSYACRDHLTL